MPYERPRHCRRPSISSTSSSSLGVVRIGVILKDLALLKTDALPPTSEAGILRYRRAILTIRGYRYRFVRHHAKSHWASSAVKLSGIRSWIGGELSHSSISSRSLVGAVM